MDLMVSLVILTFLYIFLKISYDALSCYILTPRRIKKIMEKQGVKGPKPGLLLGNILEMASMVAKSTSQDMDSISHDIVDRLLPHYISWSKTYGKRFIYWNGTEPRMCLTETQLIKELLSKYSTISGKSWLQQQGSKHFIGRGLLMANGQDWHHQRHMVAPVFNGDKLKSYAGYMVECTKKMVGSLENAMERGEREFEIGEYMTRLTADIISRTEFEGHSEKGKRIFHLLTVLQRLCAQASRHFCLPGSRFFPSKYNREIKSLKMEVERLLMEIIQSRKDCVEIGRRNSYGNDLVGMLLSQLMKDKGGSGSSNLNLQLIMDECKTLFFAGQETTALLLTWTVMLLATNPNWQDRVRQEVLHVCDTQEPSFHHLPKLTLVSTLRFSPILHSRGFSNTALRLQKMYERSKSMQLNMVINESLRLYPPASVLPRMAFEDIKLGELHIPKGLSIWIPVLAIHHSEDIWGKDVNEFNPSRFASKSFASARHFIPFATGPRNCIGQAFAIMEAKIILAMLISRFSFTISENYRHAPILVLTIKPKYGVQICLKSLNN